jgi:hypothetical protein
MVIVPKRFDGDRINATCEEIVGAALAPGAALRIAFPPDAEVETQRARP